METENAHDATVMRMTPLVGHAARFHPEMGYKHRSKKIFGTPLFHRHRFPASVLYLQGSQSGPFPEYFFVEFVYLPNPHDKACSEISFGSLVDNSTFHILDMQSGAVKP